ncbi:hypothetical protein [Paraburkholderia sediminicola]|uniref:hypothetical protein n=1 Tax=Paraburkholderia sediminicola TaxID=458836 RepID=UPI0038BD7EEA
MSKSKPTTKLPVEPKDSVREMTKKVAPMTLILPLLATGVSYAAYADDLSVSGWPWRIGLLVTLACFLAPFLIYSIYRRTNLLWVCGLVQSIGIFAVYFFFGTFAYFYYFIFVPLPPLVKWTGLLGGVALTLYWVSISRQVSCIRSGQPLSLIRHSSIRDPISPTGFSLE